MTKPPEGPDFTAEPAGPVVHVRPASPADAAFVAELVLELLDELAAPEKSGYELSAAMVTAAALLRDESRAWAFLACAGVDHVGVITLAECAAIYARGRFGEITELYVRPPYRRSAVGQRLIDAAVELARREYWTRLEVGAPLDQKWQRSVAFYQRVGFVEIGPRLKLELAG